MKKIIDRKLMDLVSLDINKYVRRAVGRVEENVKIKLTLPLLELLGYDVQKDLDFEHHVRDKRADIALLFESVPKLIVETKDLDANLDYHVNQALDYAFNKGVDWVVLTNGIEIRLYKSYITGVPPLDRKIFSTQLNELPQTFPSLAERISKENLHTAKRIIKEAEEVRETVTANTLIKDLAECKKMLFLDLSDQFKIRYKNDQKFKEIIETWADRINMSLDDPKLIDKLCTERAYTLINRLLFLRICEDRGHVKAKFSKDNLKEWRAMVEKPSRMLGLTFAEIAEKFEGLYRAPLFDDIRFEDIKWNEEAVNFILNTLGEHDFSQITKDILGRAYEQHISKKERKELGQFYTPDFVIDYILDRVDLSPDKKLLDPACGSGGFLLKTYDRLREIYRDEGWAGENIHNEILKKNLYGIDINPFATQLTVMNLFLKDLDHPTSHINIAEGDSLERLENSLDLDYFQKVSPLNKVTNSNKRYSHGMILKQMPFDTVVGNPPYISFGVRGSRDLAKKKRAWLDLLREKYPNSAEYKISIYAIFLQRGIELLKPGGKLGFIVPDSFLLGRYFSKLRKYILNNCAIVEVVLFMKDFWKSGIVGRPVIIVLRKELDEKKRKSNEVTAKLYATWEDINQDKFKSYSYPQSYFEKARYNRFRLFFDKDSKNFVTEIEEGSIPLGGESGIVTIHVGVRSKIGQDEIVSESKKGRNWQRGLISGGQVQHYTMKYEGHFINIDPHLLWAGGWDPKIVSGNKLLLRKTGDSLIATYDDKGYYHLDNLHSIVLANKDFNLKYVLAILNSKLMNHYYHLISLELGRTMAQTDIETIEQLPIKKAPQITQRDIAKLVDKILALNEQLPKAKTSKHSEDLKKEIEIIKEQIENKIKKIYEKDTVALGEIIRFSSGLIGKEKKAKIISLKKQSDKWLRGLVNGNEVTRYSILYKGNFILYDTSKLKSGFKDANYFEPKIFLRKTGDAIVATIDKKNLLSLDNLHVGNLINKQFDLRYIIAILNSRMMNEYYNCISLELGRIMAQTDIETLEQLPIKKASKITQRKIASLVDKILLLNEQLQKAKIGKQANDLKKEIEVVDEKIEKEVRKIYGFDQHAKLSN